MRDDVYRLPVSIDAEERVARALCEADGVRPWKDSFPNGEELMARYRAEAKRHIFAWRELELIVREGRRP